MRLTVHLTLLYLASPFHNVLSMSECYLPVFLKVPLLCFLNFVVCLKLEISFFVTGHWRMIPIHHTSCATCLFQFQKFLFSV
uniref:Putative secreted protein n=1 Tax=Panstrongylus lignarius TaxID=156445 RepID=A0A224XZM9_9HEMI